MCDCKNCQCESEGNQEGFIFGLLLGAIIGAVIAILIYKNNQTEVFANLKAKLEKYFRNFTEEKPVSKKISVVIPPKVESVDITPKKTSAAKPHKFLKPKK
jgi:hypothetical protein